MKKRIAITGCGGMGSGHAIAIASGTGNAVWGARTSADRDSNLEEDYSLDSNISKKLELAGIYDIDPKRVKWAKQQGYFCYGSYEEILEDPSVDIVLIATPNHLHKMQAIQAMRAGKHVLCEKPVMMSSAELLEVMKVSEETNCVFYPRQNRRWDRDFRIVKNLYDNRTLGNIFRLESRIHGSRGIPGDWRGEQEFGGGMMMDWGVHLLDRLLWMMIPEKVTALSCQLSHVTNVKVDDGFRLDLTFSNGMTALVEVGTCNFISLPIWYMTGDRGSAVIRNWKCEGEMVTLKSWEDKDAVPILAGAGLTKTMAPRNDQSLTIAALPDVRFDHNELYCNLVDVIDGKAEQIVTQEHALRVLHVMEAAIQSGLEDGKRKYLQD